MVARTLSVGLVIGALVAALLVAPGAGYAQASPHMTPAGWAAFEAMNDASELAPEDPDRMALCRGTPPANGDEQAATVQRLCVISVRWLEATEALSKPRQARATAASLVRQSRELQAGFGSLAAQVSGDCHRFFQAYERALRTFADATTDLSRSLRAGKPREPATMRWYTRVLKTLVPLTEKPVTSWVDACQPPATS